MIGILSKQLHIEAIKLVEAAFRRSVSEPLVTSFSPAIFAEQSEHIGIAVAINPDDADALELERFLASGDKKVVIFGSLPERLVQRLFAKRLDWPECDALWSKSLSAATYAFAESKASIRYIPDHPLTGGGDWNRALERFDFMDEWNNLGFGAITQGDSIWSLSQSIQVPVECCLADVMLDNKKVCSYAALSDEQHGSILWFNRPVGPIDSFEWHLVERFLASWRHETLPVVPVLLDLPWGHDAAITMRLDCDEDISSATELWRTYQKENIPFSLAIHTSNLNDDTHYDCLRNMLSEGVALLSHSATHAPNWGGSYEAAFHEASYSAQQIYDVTQYRVKYAVSPFHQTPEYSIQALCDSGYRGCIGGIIRNDPEFLFSRGGELAGMPKGFIGHSQQVMLHGDCLLEGEEPLAIYKKAFDLFYNSKMLFGYLDHPFSPRYQYGWESETQRLNAHKELIHYIQARAISPIFLSENDALDFILDKTSVVFEKIKYGYKVNLAGIPRTTLSPTLLFKNVLYKAEDGTILR